MKPSIHSFQKIILFNILLFACTSLHAQTDENAKTLEKYKSANAKNRSKYQNDKDAHLHKGLYIGLGLGPAFGAINDEPTSYGKSYKIEGSAFTFDFRIGGNISENLILTFDMTSRSISSPTIVFSDTTIATSSNISLNESCYGLGLTYYLMPNNIYIGGTIGRGYYTISDRSRGTSAKSDYGYSGSIRIGKQWWVSKNWGLGASLIGSNTSVKNTMNGYTEKISGPRLTLMFQATFH
jgi:hypothetical protein